MKKFALLSLLALSAGSLTAQQINGTFDDAWNKCFPYYAPDKQDKEVGTEPQGWHTANVYQTLPFELTKEIEGSGDQSGKAVYVFNRFAGFSGLGQVAPGYLTLGTPWNTAKVNIFGGGISEKDGGTFGGVSFAHRPDSIRFSYKRQHGRSGVPQDMYKETDNNGQENMTETASVVAYLWKGSYTSSVPVGTGSIMGGAPPKEQMLNRDKDVMGMITDGVTKSEDAECIATINYAIEGDQAEWKTLTIPFNYTSDATPEKINVIFSSADYFGDREAIGVGNSLAIDDVELIYNSQLASLAYNGTTVNGFATDNYETLDMSSVTYDASKLAYTSNGAGATVETHYDETTALLTLTVKGNDVSTNPSNTHTYTVQFKEPVTAIVTSIAVAGETLATFDPAVTDYVLPFPYDRSLVVDFMTNVGMFNSDIAYDDNAKTITLTVESGLGEEIYTLRFTDAVADAPLSGTYGGSLSVVLMGQATPLANAPIDITINTDGTANLTLKDFTFAGTINVGDIYVPHIPVADGKALSATRTISFPHGMAASLLGELPVTVTANVIGENQIEADIDIDTKGSSVTMFGTIHVDFTPLVMAEAATAEGLAATGRLTSEGASLLTLSQTWAKRYIDLSAATVDSDVELDALFGGHTVKNTLVYLPANATVEGDNVIVGTECQKLVLTEGDEFFAPKAFTAKEVSFDRDFATDMVSTFVMPFTFDVPESMTVSKLTKVEGTSLTFSPVTTAEAGVPYLIETTTARPFDALTDIEVPATTTTDVTVGGVTHHGAFAKENVTSGTTAYYGWNENGEFVKATTGTLLPFRTYLTTEAALAAPAFKVIMDETTGIDAITTTEADGAIYDLSGRRVEKAVKGIYIQNGKKIYVK